MNGELPSELARILTDIIDLGGPGSGNWGHAGRPGKRGGSAPRTGGAGGTVTHGHRALAVREGIDDPEAAERQVPYTESQLTREERSALFDYVHNMHKLFNAFLRGKSHLQPMANDFIAREIEHVIDACDKLPQFHGTTVRGMNFRNQDDFDSFMQDVTYCHKNNVPFVHSGFMSTTWDLDTAERFASTNMDTVGRAYVIVNGLRGVALGPLGYNKGEEHEVLFVPDSRFTVVSVERENPDSNLYYITMDEV